jgi:XTP/dITP diphosphohydrolase
VDRLSSVPRREDPVRSTGRFRRAPGGAGRPGRGTASGAVVLASRNPNKARELELLLPGWTIEPLEADDYPPEVGATYYDNARAKALFGRGRAGPEAWVLGEDSGLEVEGLGAAPGVRSSRSAAGDEVGWILRELADVDGDGRRARYVCELVALSPEGQEFCGTGTLEGRIAESAAGEGGFGFDPVFVPLDVQRTVAELGDDWKAQHSHRANAARALLRTLGQAG